MENNKKLKLNSTYFTKNIPMTVLLSSMTSSTILNLLIISIVMLKFGKFKTALVEESFNV